MANQTKAQAKRSLLTIKSKILKLYSYGYLKQTDFLTMTDRCEKALNRLK